MYAKSKNVVYVEGARNSLLYNFNNTSLYKVSKQWNKEINEILINPEKNKKLIEFLIDEKIIVSSEQKEDCFIEIPNPKIEHAWIEVTNMCNLKCIHCYEGKKSNQLMDIAIYRKIVDCLKANNIHSIQLTGGEPLLHPRIIDMIKYATEIFSNVELYTNGTLLTPEIIKLCNKLKVKLAITKLSSDTLSYDDIVGIERSQKKYLTAIKNVKQYSESYRFGQIAIQKNKVEGNEELPRLVGNAKLFLYTPNMLEKKIITEAHFKKHFIRGVVASNFKYNICFSNKIYIDSNYNIYPCPMERRIMHSNFLDNKYRLVLNSNIIHMTKDFVNECSICEYRYACNDCRPDSMNQKITEKPWYCSYDPSSGEWADVNDFIKKLYRKEQETWRL